MVLFVVIRSWLRSIRIAIKNLAGVNTLLHFYIMQGTRILIIAIYSTNELTSLAMNRCQISNHDMALMLVTAVATGATKTDIIVYLKRKMLSYMGALKNPELKDRESCMNSITVPALVSRL